MQTLGEVDKPAHAPSKGGPPPTSPLQQRWQQMDWDQDGTWPLLLYSHDYQMYEECLWPP